MKSKLLFAASLVLAISSLPLRAEGRICWTDESMKPDTTWFTQDKTLKEYTVSTPEQLAGLAWLVSPRDGKSSNYTFEGVTIRLGGDISLLKEISSAGGTEDTVLWQPIGDAQFKGRTLESGMPFMGIFDGQNHTIDGLLTADGTTAGLFGYIKGAEIKNVRIGAKSKIVINDGETSGNSGPDTYAGAVFAYADSSTVTGCTNEADVMCAHEGKHGNNCYAGGIGGCAVHTLIDRCENSGRVADAYRIAGVIAYAEGSYVVNCTNHGDVIQGEGDNSLSTGGIAGETSGGTSVYNCLNAGYMYITYDRRGAIIGSLGTASMSGLQGVRNNLNVGEIVGDKASRRLYTIGYMVNNSLALRNYSVKNDAADKSSAIPVAKLSADSLKSDAMLVNLNSYAGYLNRHLKEKGILLMKWELKAGADYPTLTDVAADETYRMAVTYNPLATVTFDGNYSEDDRLSVYNKADAEITVTVTPPDGYTFEGIKVDGGDLQAGVSSFKQQARDMTMEVEVSAGEMNTWETMAQYALDSTDYIADEKQNAYYIYTPKGLAYVARLVNDGSMASGAEVVLYADIDLAVKNSAGETLKWIPAGTAEHPFSFTLNGNGKTISGIYVDTESDYAGLLGYAADASITDLTLDGVCAVSTTGSYAGGVAGLMSGQCVVTGCVSQASVKAASRAGGIAGKFSGNLSASSNEGTVTATEGMAGGLAAQLNAGSRIENSYNSGKIEAGAEAGGLVAETSSAGADGCVIANSYNGGSVNGGSLAAGVAARAAQGDTIKNTLSYGVVKGSETTGGVVADNSGAALVRNYYLKDNLSVSVKGATPLDEADVKSSALSNEMQAFAGYMNRIDGTKFYGWKSDSDGYPDLTTSAAKKSFVVRFVMDSDHGSFTLASPDMNVLAQDSALYLVSTSSMGVSATVKIEFSSIEPEAGYVCAALTLNGEDQTKSPVEDQQYSVTIKDDAVFGVTFSQPTRWDQYAAEAEEGTDYRWTGKYDTLEIYTPLGMAFLTNEMALSSDGFEGVTVKLMNDIDLGEKNTSTDTVEWYPIGGSDNKHIFAGVFDGQGHTVKNMIMDDPDATYGGLIGYLSGTVRNVTVQGGHLNAKSMVGGVVGAAAANKNALIINCNNIGCNVSATHTAGSAGGIVGMVMKTGQVINCSSRAVTSSPKAAGGVVGNLMGDMTNCVAAGNAEDPLFGSSTGTVKRCYYIAVEGETSKPGKGTGITSEVMYSQELVTELTAYAGHLNNSETPVGAAGWIHTGTSLPLAGTAVAAKSYSVTVAEGTDDISLRLISNDADSTFYANAASPVAVVVDKDGYKLDSITVNGGSVEADNGSFLMPEADVLLSAPVLKLFDTWNDYATQAKPGEDYTVEDNVITILTPKGLAFMSLSASRGELAGTYRLAADIDLTLTNGESVAVRWIPAGSEARPFSASFDGDGHTVDGMLINDDRGCAGLIGYAENANITGLTVGAKSTVSGSANYIAAVVGYADNCTITDCHNLADVNSTAKLYTAGIAAKIDGESIVNGCTNSGNITTTGGQAAGIVALAGSTSGDCHIFNCENSGAVVAATTTAGGIAAMLQGNRAKSDESVWGTIRNCVNRGTVTAKSMAGGIVGMMNALAVENCVNAGSVTATQGTEKTYAGAIAGMLSSTASVKKNGLRFYRNYTISGCVYNDGGIIADDVKTELSESVMQDEALAAELTSYAGYLDRTVGNVGFRGWRSADGGTPTLGTDNAVHTYSVTIDSDGLVGGTVSLPEMITVDDSAFYAAAGEDVTLTVTADEGYTLRLLMANDTEIDGGGTFFMPEEDVTITASFTKDVSSSLDEVTSNSVTLWSSHGLLNIALEAESRVQIFTVDGRCVITDNARIGDNSYPLPPSVYVVVIGGNTYKVSVI